MESSATIRLDSGCLIVQKNRLRMVQGEREVKVKRTTQKECQHHYLKSGKAMATVLKQKGNEGNVYVIQGYEGSDKECITNKYIGSTEDLIWAVINIVPSELISIDHD